MGSLQRTSDSIIITSSSGLLVIRCYRIAQTTIDSLADNTFRFIFQYLSTQFDLTILELDSSGLKLYIGLFLKEEEIPQSRTLDQKFNSHLDHIFPSMIEYELISGYEISLSFYHTMETHESSIKIEDTYLGIYALHDLDVFHYHSSILKMLLENNCVSLYFASFSEGKTEKHYITMKISTSSKNDFQSILSQITHNLKKSPYISGKLYNYKVKDIMKSRGLFSLGFTSHTSSSLIFNNLLELFPSVIPSPRKISIPIPYPRISSSINSLNNQPNLSSSPGYLDKKEQQVDNPIGCRILPDTDIKNKSIELPHSFIMMGWETVNFEENNDYTLLSLQNEQLIIDIVVKLYDFKLDPVSIKNSNSSFLFLMLDSSINLMDLHPDWVIIPESTYIKSLLIS